MNDLKNNGMHGVKIAGNRRCVRIYIDGIELKRCLSFRLEKSSASEPTKLFVEFPVNDLEIALDEVCNDFAGNLSDIAQQGDE